MRFTCECLMTKSRKNKVFFLQFGLDEKTMRSQQGRKPHDKVVVWLAGSISLLYNGCRILLDQNRFR